MISVLTKTTIRHSYSAHRQADRQRRRETKSPTPFPSRLLFLLPPFPQLCPHIPLSAHTQYVCTLSSFQTINPNKNKIPMSYCWCQPINKQHWIQTNIVLGMHSQHDSNNGICRNRMCQSKWFESAQNVK